MVLLFSGKSHYQPDAGGLEVQDHFVVDQNMLVRRLMRQKETVSLSFVVLAYGRKEEEMKLL